MKTKLAAKKYSCANDISDIEPVKKTVTKDGKPTFEFTKPQDPATFETFKKCIQEGTGLIDRAEKLDTNSDAVWSYKANMLIQQSRLAEMEGNKAQLDSLKAEADKAKARFSELSAARKAKEDAEHAKKRRTRKLAKQTKQKQMRQKKKKKK